MAKRRQSRATVLSKRRRQQSMLPVQEYVIIERYRLDSSTAYDCDEEELQVLIGEFGEMEPIIDAMNVLSGASVEQRARDIGCDPEDFAYEIQGF
jgi:hypothetical protein